MKKLIEILKRVFFSLLAVLIGIQSQKNREEDFKKGKFYQYIIGGFFFSFLLILGMIKIVDMVIIQARIEGLNV